MHKFFARNVILYVHPLFNRLIELCSFVATVMSHCILDSELETVCFGALPGCTFVLVAPANIVHHRLLCTETWTEPKSVRKDINHVTSPNRLTVVEIAISKLQVNTCLSFLLFFL